MLNVKISLEYVDMSNPSNRSNSILDIYQRDEDENVLQDMLLLGKTGSGKSTSLKELTLELIEIELKKVKDIESVKFPIFLPLHEWSPKRNLSKYG